MKTRILTILTIGAAAVAFSGPVIAGDKDGKHHGKMFEKHDTNGDGVISKDEAMSHAEARFDKMDKDGDGEVTQDEAKAAKEKMRAKWKEMKEKKDAMDSGDGEAAE
ncbi:MAG: hypothetical protein JKY71_07950 [Alphaproteobacteria bacterium]|nr:hypothetical protein [Alphaproteobacteria bacterium]